MCFLCLSVFRVPLERKRNSSAEGIMDEFIQDLLRLVSQDHIV